MMTMILIIYMKNQKMVVGAGKKNIIPVKMIHIVPVKVIHIIQIKKWRKYKNWLIKKNKKNKKKLNHPVQI